MATEFFSVGVSYEIVTPESAEHGDADERGWEHEHEPMTLRDAFDVLTRYGPYDSISGPADRLTFYDLEGSTDYRTAEVTTYAVHVHGTARNVARLLAILDARDARRNAAIRHHLERGR